MYISVQEMAESFCEKNNDCDYSDHEEIGNSEVVSVSCNGALNALNILRCYLKN